MHLLPRTSPMVGVFIFCLLLTDALATGSCKAHTTTSAIVCDDEQVHAVQLLQTGGTKFRSKQVPALLGGAIADTTSSILQERLGGQTTTGGMVLAGDPVSVGRSKAPAMPLGIVAIVVLAVQAVLFGGLAVCFYLESKLLQNWVGHLGYWHKVVAMSVMFLITAFLGALLVPYFIGALVRLAVEHYDVSYIGAKVQINEIAVQPFNGNIWMTEVTLGNPVNSGPHTKNWTSAYLLKAESIHTQLSVSKLIFSFGRTMLLEPLAINGVDVVVESLPSGDSNANQIVNFIESQPASGRAYQVREISLTGLKVKAQQLIGRGQSIPVPDLYFDDAANISMNSLVQLVLQSVLKNAMRLALR